MEETIQEYDELLNAIESERQAIIIQLEDVHKKHGGKLTEEYYAENYTLWREQIAKEKESIEALLPEARKKGSLQSTIFQTYMRLRNTRLNIDQ